MKKTGALTGALVGALVTAPLIAVMFLAWQLAGLPFLPFELFDWLARRLPGGMVTFGIDTLVAIIRALELGEISAAAKTAEQGLALAIFFILGMAAGAILFALLRRAEPRRPRLRDGAAFGVVIGILLLLIRLSLDTTSRAGPVFGGVWVVVLSALWGASFVWAFQHLRREPAANAATFEAQQLDRRRFLIRLGGASAVITVAGAGIGALTAMRKELRAMRARGSAWSATNPLPNANAEVQPVAETRSELTQVEDHYRIDINTRPPMVEEDEWRLRVGGLVARPLELTLADLRTRYEPMHQFITLSCISNPIAGDLTSTSRWTGVSLRRLLEAVRPKASATHLRIRSVDGYHEVVSLADVQADARIMLTYDWDGLPLPNEHGFPLRIYIPDRYGMKQPKWIESIQAIDRWEAGYWVERGWDREARMKTTSVIDVVASDMMVIDADHRQLVPIGGIAHAGARGISRVEVSVDGGPWQQALLRDPLSPLTWVIWRFDWAFEPGEHTFTVRCIDGAGVPQIAERAPLRPSGATGLHSETVML
ncbi:MAG: molybdopterin-dependent oxidoreductase [Gemmatimonadota bacterium]